MTHNITHIPLDEYSSLRLEKPFYYSWAVWWLYRGDNMIRSLDKFEAGFVNAAIAAAQKGWKSE
jgi:hypothetical protein